MFLIDKTMIVECTHNVIDHKNAQIGNLCKMSFFAIGNTDLLKNCIQEVLAQYWNTNFPNIVESDQYAP